jgi:hypothetical protein
MYGNEPFNKSDLVWNYFHEHPSEEVTPKKLAQKLDKAVKASGKSKSKWVAGAIKRSLQDQWPDGFFDLAGSWEDDFRPDEVMSRIRTGMDKPDRREKLY